MKEFKNCNSCKNEFIDKERSGDIRARLCRPCWDNNNNPLTIDWINQNIINEVGMCSNKSVNCPDWESK